MTQVQIIAEARPERNLSGAFSFVMAGRGAAMIMYRLVEMRGRLKDIRQLIDSVLKGGDDKEP